MRLLKFIVNFTSYCRELQRIVRVHVHNLLKEYKIGRFDSKCMVFSILSSLSTCDVSFCLFVLYSLCV
jgi:hypothetical protein